MKKIIIFIFSLLCLFSYSTAYAAATDIDQLTIKAEKGDAESQYNLALAYDEGEDIDVDHEKAVYWYQKAADQGYVNAMYNLAVSYDEGEGVTQDKQKAVFWYQKGADAGDHDSQNNLGVMYENGEGVTKDNDKAIFWYTKSAKQANSLAQYNVAFLYQELNKNLVEAYAWSEASIKNGDSDAKELRRTIWRKLSDEDKPKAKELAQKYVVLYCDDPNS